MAPRVIVVHLVFVLCAVVCGSRIPDAMLGRGASRGRPTLYTRDMKTLLMRDEAGRPFRAILGDDNVLDVRTSLSESAADSVTFYLFTRDYNSAVQVFINDSAAIDNTTFNKNNPTVVLVHGFLNSFHSDSVQLIREAYLSGGEANIVCVDWSALASGPWYYRAARETHEVGLKVAQLVDFLVRCGAAPARLHLVGHSLGAHVAGVAAKNLRAGKIARVTGLDPALPLFTEQEASRRIDASDAEMVDCIHTCGGLLGFYYPICSHDYYPNGGSLTQPGCWFDIFGDCSHERSYQYYAESIHHAFIAERCEDIAGVENASCADGLGVMGHHAPGTPSGIYYLTTNKMYPFSKE